MVTREDFEETGFVKLNNSPGVVGIERYELDSIFVTFNPESSLTLITNSEMLGMINFKGLINNAEELKHIVASINADNKIRYELND